VAYVETTRGTTGCSVEFNHVHEPCQLSWKVQTALHKVQTKTRCFFFVFARRRGL